jgi:hypothetical protein
VSYTAKWRSRPETWSVRRASSPGPALRTGLHENRQRGRVQELDLAEVDDEPLGLALRRLDERRAHLVRVVEVELSRQANDDRRAVRRDLRHRAPAEPGRILVIVLRHPRILPTRNRGEV